MYHVDPQNGDLVINGFDQGIGDSPYTGLVDARNVNLLSVPGEASVNFATSKISSSGVSGTITSISGTQATFTTSGTSATLEGNMAIYFTSSGSYSGFTQATPYWVTNNPTLLNANKFSLYTSYAAAVNQGTMATFSGSGTAAFEAYKIGIVPPYVTSAGVAGGIQYFTEPTNLSVGGSSINYAYGVDMPGMVWSNRLTTGTNNFWTYMGNSITDQTGNLGDKGTSNTIGNGLAYVSYSNNSTTLAQADVLYVFRNSQIDMMPLFINGSLPGAFYASLSTWNYSWNPGSGNFDGLGNPAQRLIAPKGTGYSHHAIVAPDGRLYFCDTNCIEKVFQASATSIFNPLDTASYAYTTYQNLIPANDICQCLAPSGSTILIGGQGSFAYSWDRVSQLVNFPIPVAEPFIARIVTVNVNSYIFAGNRGRIYITNGSQAEVWKKIPDHVLGTIEPKFQWGGATAVKNQLYFSFSATNNDGTVLSNGVGGLWAVDLKSGAMRITNQLSYGTYSGYATALLPQPYNPVVSVSPSGASLWIGWTDGTGTNFGVDKPSSTVYTGGQAFVTSDMIPVGTLLRPSTAHQIECKLSAPLAAGEKVILYQGSYFDMSYSSFSTLGTMTYTTNTNQSNLAANFGIQQQNEQWMIVKAVSVGSSGTPTFNRLTELRIIGATGKITGYPAIT